jgi:hypothetical protein
LVDGAIQFSIGISIGIISGNDVEEDGNRNKKVPAAYDMQETLTYGGIGGKRSGLLCSIAVLQAKFCNFAGRFLKLKTDK